MKRTQFFFILCILLFQSCFKSEVRSQFDIAESVLQSHPDSALSIMRKIDYSNLSPGEDKARYSLLMTAALDKTPADSAGQRQMVSDIKELLE